MNWIADPNAKHSAEFVCLSLQSWIPRYQGENMNPSLASLAQVMVLKRIHQRLRKLL